MFLYKPNYNARPLVLRIKNGSSRYRIAWANQQYWPALRFACWPSGKQARLILIQKEGWMRSAE
eukprot:805852-Pyramimonas_sp.AAC.1